LLCTTAFLFANGGGEETTKYEMKPEISAATSPITISVFTETAAYPRPAANNPIVQYIKDKMNVTLNWDILVGDIAQRRGTMIAGGQYPDILEVRGNEWIDAGALIPLEGYIDKYAPRIKAHYKDVWNKMKSADGHIYYLINFHVYQGTDFNPNYDQTAFWVQKEVLKDAGYPKVATVDQYFNLIENYYKKTPTINGQPTIPFVILTHDWRAFELWNPPNFLAGNPNDGNGVVDPKTYKYTVFFTQEISKRWFKKLNEFDKKGLIDRASFTDTYDQYSAKISSGRVLGQSVQGWQFIYGPDLANRDRRQNNRTMAPLPVVWDANTTPRYRTLPILNILRGMGISVSAKDPVRIMRFLNELISEDVQRTINWGIEGQHWQWDAQKKPYRTAQQRTNWQNDNWQNQNRLRLLEDVFPKLQGSFSDGYPTDLSWYFPEREAAILPEDKELWAAYGVTNNNELVGKQPAQTGPWFPAWSVPTPPDGSPAQIALSRMEQIMKQRLPQMILAPTADFEKLWADYVKEMNDAGLANYEKHMQDQLNIRLKEWGIKK
jgi:putative aldouronate transport system substrate-binding protein